MQVQGWLIHAPQTAEIVFIPTTRECSIKAKSLPWQNLGSIEIMQNFTTDFLPKPEFLTGCRCYFIDSESNTLEVWFAEHEQILQNTSALHSVQQRSAELSYDATYSIVEADKAERQI